MPNEILNEFLQLSWDLGDPACGWAILGEGNTSARIDEEMFLVKASGAQLAELTETQVVPMRFGPLLEALHGAEQLDDHATKQLLRSSTVTGRLQESAGEALSLIMTSDLSAAIRRQPAETSAPSVETLFHAELLSLPGVDFVGHTHVTSINSLLCSERGWELMQQGGRLFPDEIVVCGVAPCCVPYVDPGLPLARAIRSETGRFAQQHGVGPKTIYLQNHGFIALGGSGREVLAITRMADKAAQIMLGAIACGGPRFLSDADVARIAGRPDEHLRQQALGLTKS